MRLIRTREMPGAATAVEVEGHLDAVTAHDLRRVLKDLVRQGCGHITLDLTRVQHADADGVDALAWCSGYATHSGRVLTWMGCSRPLRNALDQIVARGEGETSS